MIDNYKFVKIVIPITIVLFLTVIFCSCQKDERVMPSDNAKLITSSGFFDNFFETEDGYYYNASGRYWYDSMIYFCGKGTNVWTPLCNRANCKHNNTDCNAFGGGLAMTCFEGVIYAVEQISVEQCSIIRMDMDGNNHFAVCDTPTVASLVSTGGQGGGFYRFVDGYLVNFIQYPIDVHKNATKFCRVDLKSGEQKWMFESDIGDDVLAAPPSYAANGEILFTYTSVNTKRRYLASGNYLTGSLNWVIPDWDTSHGSVSIYQGDYVFYKTGDGFYSLDTKTGTETRIISENYYYMYPFYTDNHIICSATTSSVYSDTYIVVYDSDYNKINEFELDTSGLPKVPFGFPVSICGISTNAIWFKENLTTGSTVTHYLPRSEIFSGSPTLIEVNAE